MSNKSKKNKNKKAPNKQANKPAQTSDNTDAVSSANAGSSANASKNKPAAKSSNNTKAKSNDKAKASKSKGKETKKDPKKKPSIFKRIATYFKNVRLEIKRTTWPTRHEVLNMTIIVIIALIFFGVLIFLIDQIMVMLLGAYGATPLGQANTASSAASAASSASSAASSSASSAASSSASSTSGATSSVFMGLSMLLNGGLF